MPAPSFGFSAGDFVDAVNVFTDVCKALTDAGGAAEDYRQTVCQLELLEKSIHQLLTEHLIPTFTQGAQESLVECARKQADMTLQTLQEGLKAISKFEAKLGTQAKAGFFRGAGRKAQWATMQTKDVEKLRAKLGTQLQNLNSLLHALTAQCTMSGILTLETTIKDHSVDQSTALWLSNREIRAAITAESETLAKSYNDIMEAINNISKNTSREIVMQRSVTPMKFSVEPDAVDERLLSVNERGSAGDFLMRLLRIIVERLRDWLIKTSAIFPRLYAIAYPLVTARARELALSASYNITFENGYIPTFTIVAGLGEWLIKTLTLLPRLHAMTYSTVANIAREPMLSIPDSITFEDVLGRTLVLQYDFYRHWPNFESLIQQQFRNLPGEHQVMSGRFMLRDSTSPQKIVHQNLWQSVTPGSRLFMSIEVPQETEKTTKCRRSGCGGMLESNQEHLKCQACGFECFLLTNSSTSDVEPVQSTAYGPSSKNLHALEGGVFSTEFRHVYQLIGPTGTKPPGVQRLEEAFEEQSSFALGSYVRHLFWSGWLNLTMPGNPSNVPSDVITTIPSTTRTCLDILQECESRGDLYFPRSHDRHSSWKCCLCSQILDPNYGHTACYMCFHARCSYCLDRGSRL